MTPNRIKVVIDTNWWVSFVIKKFRSSLSEILMNENISIFSSEELELEIFETLTDPALSKFIDEEFAIDFLVNYSSAVYHVNVVSAVNVCRDKKDNFLLALA